MKKIRLSLLVVATVSAIILVAGCSSPTQTSPQVASSSSNTSSTTASTTTTSSSSAVKKASSVTPSPSASVSGKVSTTINGNQAFNSFPTVKRGSPETTWGFEVVPTGSAHILSVPVTVLIDGKAIGQVKPVGGSETVAFSLTSAQTNSLAAGQHTITVSFAGDSTYQPSDLTRTITVT
jgi:hypothetical protein